MSNSSGDDYQLVDSLEALPAPGTPPAAFEALEAAQKDLTIDVRVAYGLRHETSRLVDTLWDQVIAF